MSKSRRREAGNSDTDLTERLSDAYLLGRLVRGFVHTTGNNLQVVLGAADSLGAALLPPSVDRRLAMIVEAAADVAGRTNDLRDLAMALSADARATASGGTFAETVVASVARIERLLSSKAEFDIGIEPRLGELPAPSSSELRTLERLLACLSLHVLSTVPTNVTPRLHVDAERCVDPAVLRIALDALCPRVETASTAAASPGETDFALLRVLSDSAGAELERAAESEDGQRIRLTLSLHSIDVR